MTRRSKARRERDAAAPGGAYPSAYIEIDEDTWVRTLWHVQLEGRDIIGWMYKPARDEWRIGYRWRHYRDDKVWDSTDEKSAVRIRLQNHQTPTEAELAEAEVAITFCLELLVREIATVGLRGTLQKHEINALGAEAGAAVRALSWAHAYNPGQTSSSKPPGKA